MSKAAAKKAPRKKNGYVMPDPLPQGEVLCDIFKKKWVLGPSIGKGGFGEIYSATNQSNAKQPNYPYVVKIEPHENGPLFVEMHFYKRNAKFQDIENFRMEKKYTNLGMPRYVGSGSHDHDGKKYRFLVMERFGKDLWDLYLENNKCFPAGTVYHIGIQILDALEYIHSKGYVHADIKGANTLLGSSKATENQVYLVDFGLASHYTTGEFKPDPKKAHNGTIEYTSRDAHAGVPTRRGDIEILAYNLIHWLGGKLPWESCLTNPISVQAGKEKCFENISEFLNKCFGKNNVPDQIKEIFECISKMKHNTEPDYKKIRSILISGLEANGHTFKSPLIFTGTKSPKRKLHLETPTPEKKRKLEKIKRDIPKKPRAKKVTKQTDSSEPNDKKEEFNGFTPAMQSIMQKLEDAKMTKKTVKSRKVKSPIVSISSEDIIEETPPKKSRTRAINRKNYKEESFEDSPKRITRKRANDN